ncbi:UDP-glucose 4-epimerase GalE, partial [Candidatus Saccharibacteria bacterium]|nr:UDP-glucose 4-epimerase GalE [Candidatus Saccharibacteria bacterium]
MRVLVTGGAGYIGSHTVVELLEAGHEVVVVDNLCNSSEESLRRVSQITGKPVEFRKVDVCDKHALGAVFDEFSFAAVMHFAGLKAVGESVEKPLLYYQNNVTGTITLLEIMAKYSVDSLVFSSSATVYGSAPYPYVETETTGVGIVNPYGQTKHTIEQIMRDTVAANQDYKYVALRYFNPVGAHASGMIGEDPRDIPNNLMPYIAQTAVGRRDKLRIFGGDYDTIDGTGVRDYIHVSDLAQGHLLALEKLQPGFTAINLGTGKGTSVLQMVEAFSHACGKKIGYEIVARRAGDLPEFFADATKAYSLLGWKTKKS